MLKQMSMLLLGRWMMKWGSLSTGRDALSWLLTMSCSQGTLQLERYSWCLVRVCTACITKVNPFRQSDLLFWTLQNLTHWGCWGWHDPGWRLVHKNFHRRWTTWSSSCKRERIKYYILHVQHFIHICMIPFCALLFYMCFKCFRILSLPHLPSVCHAPEQQPCLGSFGESASNLSVASPLSTSRAVNGVTNWCSTARVIILWVIFLFLTAVVARDLEGSHTAAVKYWQFHKFAVVFKDIYIEIMFSFRGLTLLVLEGHWHYLVLYSKWYFHVKLRFGNNDQPEMSPMYKEMKQLVSRHLSLISCLMVR